MQSDQPPIPADVRRLIEQRIRSVPHLEMLLLLQRTPTASLGPTEVGATLGLGGAAAASALADLAGAGLIAESGSATAGEPAYRFAPANVALQGAVLGLEAAYNTRRYEVLDLVGKAPSSAQAFSDAFRLR